MPYVLQCNFGGVVKSQNRRTIAPAFKWLFTVMLANSSGKAWDKLTIQIFSQLLAVFTVFHKVGKNNLIVTVGFFP